jgi:hypothetical protein
MQMLYSGLLNLAKVVVLPAGKTKREMGKELNMCK